MLRMLQSNPPADFNRSANLVTNAIKMIIRYSRNTEPKRLEIRFLMGLLEFMPEENFISKDGSQI